MPICITIHRLRPCTSPLEADAQTQQGFIDERASLHIPIVADSSRTSVRADTTESGAKELRASLPKAASSHASSLRLDDETKEQLVRFAKQARTTKKGVGTLQDVSSFFQKLLCEHQRNGYLQMRMIGTRHSNKKKLLKKNDGDRNLHFPSCPPDVQAALRERRRAEWKKLMNLNAGVILTDEEVRRLTEAVCKIYPWQWIEVEKNEQVRRSRADWWVVETSRKRRDFAQVLQLVMWIRTVPFAVGVHRLKFPSTRAISRTETFKDKKFVESCCIVSQLKVFQKMELQVEQFGLRVYTSMVQRMQDEDCGFD